MIPCRGHHQCLVQNTLHGRNCIMHPWCRHLDWNDLAMEYRTSLYNKWCHIIMISKPLIITYSKPKVIKTWNQCATFTSAMYWFCIHKMESSSFLPVIHNEIQFFYIKRSFVCILYLKYLMSHYTTPSDYAHWCDTYGPIKFEYFLPPAFIIPQ